MSYIVQESRLSFLISMTSHVEYIRQHEEYIYDNLHKNEGRLEAIP